MLSKEIQIAFIHDKYPKINKSFYLEKNSSGIQVQDNGGSEFIKSRIFQLFTAADNLYDLPCIPLVLVLIDAWNTPEKVEHIRQEINRPSIPILSFSGTDKMSVDCFIPDHHFTSLNINQLGKAISIEGDNSYKNPKIGWTGVLSNFQPTQQFAPRVNLMQLAKEYPNIIDCHFVDHLNPNDNASFELPQQVLQLSSKYCLDVEGFGYGGDLKFLL